MSKKLSEMSIEELWQLFPIVLTKHRSCWKQWYHDEEAMLKQIFPPNVQMNHVGSTAICGIWAKPIIDILAEVPEKNDFEDMKELLIRNGYTCMSQSPGRMSFNKGYTENGFAEKVFHLHVRQSGDHDELYFRDYLNEHEDVAKEYEKMKLKLWKEYEYNRDGYTEAKTEFILEYTNIAKRQFL
ncbi:MAG: GrpB family protein [Lachnospiraceae bacterium]|nr:GrpB family protein [Lachnospiraceae bacterium]